MTWISSFPLITLHFITALVVIVNILIMYQKFTCLYEMGKDISTSHNPCHVNKVSLFKNIPTGQSNLLTCQNDISTGETQLLLIIKVK